MKTLRFLDRYDLISIKEGFEVKPYTFSEFSKMKDKVDWKEVLKDKVLIMDDYGLFKEEKG